MGAFMTNRTVFWKDASPFPFENCGDANTQGAGQGHQPLDGQTRQRDKRLLQLRAV